MKALTQKGYDLSYTWGMNLHGQKFGGAIMPEMMRWLWRDGPVSTDPNDMTERTFRQPAAKAASSPVTQRALTAGPHWFVSRSCCKLLQQLEKTVRNHSRSPDAVR